MANINEIETWVEKFNAGDVSGCTALYAADASLHVVFAEPVRGREAIGAMFESYFATAPLHCIIEQLYASEERVVLEWRDKSGLQGVNIYEFEAGSIARQRNYFDQLSFLRLNKLPMPTA